jgi:hypothetical protein
MDMDEQSPQEGQQGYPEEQPADVADGRTEGDDTPPREGGEAGREHPATGNEDEGTATGNPNAAGAS